MSTQSAQWIATARMLRRSGFGTTGASVDAVLALGDVTAYVNSILANSPMDDPGALATPVPQFEVPPKAKHATRADTKRREQKLRSQWIELSAWWMRRMVAVEQPIGEKLTFLWHNHFATSVRKVRDARLMVAQNEKLRANCLGDFGTLAYSMLTDAAMVRWLDGDTNAVGSANENLAREFMELFALGHGNGYSETDVREGARALTGWIVTTDGDTEVNPERHDTGVKTVLGASGNLDAAGFCESVLAHPNSAPFVAGKVWKQLASDTPAAPQTLERLVNAYGAGRDLRALTAAVLTDPDFLDKTGTVVNGPLDWKIGLLRTLQMPSDTKRVLISGLTSLGQMPFSPPDVSGWPQGQAWLSTAAAGLRLGIATTLANEGDVSCVEDAPAGDRLDAAGYLLGVGAWSDGTAAALKPLSDNPPALVAAAANTPEYLTT